MYVKHTIVSVSRNRSSQRRRTVT